VTWVAHPAVGTVVPTCVTLNPAWIGVWLQI